MQTEQDRRLALLTDELALKSALLEQAETNTAVAKSSVEPERRENTDGLLVQTSLAKRKDAELGRLQAKLERVAFYLTSKMCACLTWLEVHCRM